MRAFIDALRKKIGLKDAPLDLCVEYAARRYCHGRSLPKNDPVVLSSFYDSVVLPCMQAQARSLGELISWHPRLTETEKLIFDVGFWIAGEFNEIFKNWWKWVVIPFRQSKLLPEEIGVRLKKAEKTNPYSILAYSGGLPVLVGLTSQFIKYAEEIPLAEAFYEEICRIQAYLSFLIDRLPRYEGAYRAYFRALRRALGNKRLKDMEELWLAVDEAWVQISHEKKVIPVHMMEHGYHDPFRISPEYRVVFRLTDFADRIPFMRKTMKMVASELSDETGSAKIDSIDIGTFLTVVNGGCGIDFRYTAQSVPNRPKAQKLGMKVFLDGDSMKIRFERLKHLLELCLDKKTLKWARPAFTPEVMFDFLNGHEFGHPLLASDKLIRVFGAERRKVEEGKASLLGILGTQLAIGIASHQEEAHLQLSAGIIAECLRMMEKSHFHDPTVASYVNECLMILSALMRQGLLRIIDNKINMDEGVAGSRAVAETLHDELTKHLIASYKKVDLKNTLDILENFANRDGVEAKAVYKLVNFNLER